MSYMSLMSLMSYLKMINIKYMDYKKPNKLLNNIIYNIKILFALFLFYVTITYFFSTLINVYDIYTFPEQTTKQLVFRRYSLLYYPKGVTRRWKQLKKNWKKLQ